MSDRQTPDTRLHALTDPHASIVQADGSVRPISTQPIPGWQNHDGSATRGAQYRDDQPAGVDNSQQAAQGSRVAAGVTGRRADTCTLGTADSPSHPITTYKTMDWACDVIRHHQRDHGRGPDCFLLTVGQAHCLAAEIARTTRGRRQLPIDSVRKGEVYLMGVPVRLFEVAHGPAQ